MFRNKVKENINAKNYMPSPTIYNMNNIMDINKNASSEIKDEYKKYAMNALEQQQQIINIPITMNDLKKENLQLLYDQGIAYKISEHNGQRKLLNSEIQFLNNVISNDLQKDNKTLFVVYAGAASGNHIPLLLNYFNVKILAIDPAEFRMFNYTPLKIFKDDDVDIFLGSTDKVPGIVIYNSFFTIELAKKLNDKAKEYNRKLLFISDIRTKEERDEYPSDSSILFNLAQQYNWIIAMKETLVACLLKFRHPFHNPKDEKDLQVQSQSQSQSQSLLTKELYIAKKNGLDLLEDYNKKRLKYFDGDIFLQSFAPSHSTETRLFIKFPFNIKEHMKDAEYESLLFYHNCINRCFKSYKNEAANCKIGYDNCFDCSLETAIWRNYYETKYKNVSTKNITESADQTTKFLKRPLLTNYHGKRC
jgi:hypothetical protein